MRLSRRLLYVISDSLKNWKHNSFPQSLGILKSDAWFGTGTSLTRAMTIFSK